MIYSIQDTTLTAIGDALRSKLGETRPVETEYAVFNYVINSFDEDVVSGEASTETKEARFVWPTETAYIIANCKYYSSSGASIFSINGQNYYGTNKLEEIRVEGNTIWLECGRINAYSYSGCYCEIKGYDADGNLVNYQDETLGTEFNGFKPENIARVIDNRLDLTIPKEAFAITGDCEYRFQGNSWNWFIENYGDRITTNDIVSMSNMFIRSTNLKNIPFEINCGGSANRMGYMFDSCQYLEELPTINFAKPSTYAYIFRSCQYLREIPDDYFDNWDFSNIDNQTSSYNGETGHIFESCYSLRKLPMTLLEHGNPMVATSYNNYNGMAYMCYSLDEIVGLPNPHINATWTSNAMNNMVDSCYRLKNLIFKDDVGSVNWKSQTLNLANNAGYSSYNLNITNYNSGITADKEVKDDATYQALKNDPDWFTSKVEYSRYNHDSAVATINSLPDTSAYLATAGGTNTIKFKGEAGSLTDGGAINTLTEEEIAVATAKGWTVSLV